MASMKTKTFHLLLQIQKEEYELKELLSTIQPLQKRIRSLSQSIPKQNILLKELIIDENRRHRNTNVKTKKNPLAK